MKKIVLSPVNLLLLYLLIVFSPVLFLDRGLFYLDIQGLDQPLVSFVVESIKNGEFPFWNPKILSGIPLLAVYPGIFYPPFVLFFIFPFHQAYGILVVFHFFLAGIGIYLICRYWKLSKAGSLTSALMFSLNGYSFEQHFVPSMLFSFVWLPFIFLFTEKLLKDDKKLNNSYFLILFCFLQMSTGRLDYFYYSQMFVWMWILFRIIQTKGYKNEKFNIINLSFIVISLFFAVGLIVIDILPLFDFVNNTERNKGILIQLALFWNLHPLQLFQLIISNFFGDLYYGSVLSFLIVDNDNIKNALFYNLYIGIPLFVIIIYGIINYKKDSKIFPLFLISLFFLILSFGKFGLIYELFYNYFPGFNILRYPIKVYFITIFCLSLIAGLGIEILSSDISLNKIFKISLFFLSILLIILISIYINTDRILNYFNSIPNNNITNLDFMIHTVLQTILFAVVFCFIIYVFQKKELKIQFFIYAFLLLISFDLINTNAPNVWTLKSDLLYNEPPTSKDIKKRAYGEKDNYRIFIKERGLKRTTINNLPFRINFILKSINYMEKDRTILFGIKNATGGYIADLIKNQNILDILESDKVTGEEFLNLNYLLGIRFFIVDKKDKPGQNLLKHNNFTFVNSYYDQDIELWEVRDANPIVSFKSKAIIGNSEKDIFNLISISDKMKINFKESVIIYNDENYKNAIKLVKKGENSDIKELEVKILEETANTLRIKAKVPSSGYIVISNNYFNGWKAYDNGIEIPILKANYAFQAIRTSSGFHNIELKYTSEPFIKGAKISIATLFLLLLLPLIIKIKKRYFTPQQNPE